jgi:hypothetical protein
VFAEAKAVKCQQKLAADALDENGSLVVSSRGIKA